MKAKILSALILLWTLLASTSAHSAEEPGAFNFDWQPPDFTTSTADGKSFQYPADLEGPTIILFWASWCPYCKALMPHLQSIVDEYEGEVRVLSLNFRDEEDPVAFLEKFGYQFLLIPDADAIAESWGVKGTPGLFLADKTGHIVFNRNAIPKDDFRADRSGNEKELKNFQKAARNAPFWAARLRQALDQLKGGCSAD